MKMNTLIPEIGSSYRFLPACFQIQSGNPMTLPFQAPDSLYVTGTVVQVHEEHRWFRVEYENRNGKMHECFKF